MCVKYYSSFPGEVAVHDCVPDDKEIIKVALVSVW